MAGISISKSKLKSVKPPITFLILFLPNLSVTLIKITIGTTALGLEISVKFLRDAGFIEILGLQGQLTWAK